MKTTETLKKEIELLKRESDTYILAHSYMSRDIIEIADTVGDSFKLSVDATKTTAKNIILCGVRFMGETAKILNPEKRVFISNPDAGCPMAEQFSLKEINEIKEKEPDRTVVAYINTSAEVKKVCDVCVTSSSALKIVNNLESNKILFIPDENLGTFIKENTNKDVMLIKGCCPIHDLVTLDDVNKARDMYKDSLLLVHPECPIDVVKAADFVGSTSAIVEFAKKSNEKSFIIGTEMNICEHLKYELGGEGKKFYPLSKKLFCPDMRITSLCDVHSLLKAINATKANDKDCDEYKNYEILMSDDDIASARGCIDEMLRLG